MMFVVLGIIMGLLLLGIKKKTSIPYTPMLLIIGGIIGYLHDKLWRVGDSMKTVVGLSAHTLLFVFIPPLIFESAYNVDYFIFQKTFFQILTMALPGVAISSILVGLVLKYILRLSMGWGELFTIGAICAATDPVAVVAILKELGTSIKFNILLEGESLLNDGTATVFFWVFFQWVQDKEFSWANFFH